MTIFDANMIKTEKMATYNVIESRFYLGEIMSGKEILEELKQEDYELWIHTQGYSHLSEEQWDWLISEFEKRR